MILRRSLRAAALSVTLLVILACSLPIISTPAPTQQPSPVVLLPTSTLPPPTFTPPPMPTYTPILLPTETYTDTPAATNTPASPPTDTPANTPTNTPTSTPTYTPTITLTPTKTLNPTKAINATRAVPFDPFCSGSIVPDSYSPDGKWAVCQGRDSFWLVNKNGTKWEYPFKVKLGLEITGKVRPFYWSLDGYVFLIYNLPWEGDGTSYYQTATLWRMNLADGRVIDLVYPALLGGKTWSAYAYEFSNYFKRLAYIAEWESPLKVSVINLKTGVTDTFEMKTKFKSGGEFAFSPDSDKLVVELAGPLKANGKWSYYSFMYFNFAKDPVAHGLFIDEWLVDLHVHKINDDIVVIRSENNYQWTLDFNTGHVVQEVLP